MSTTLDKKFENEEYRKIFAQEALLNTVQQMLAEWMGEKGVSKAELARRLGTSRSAVTQMLGGQNLTIRTLAGAIHALDGVARFEIDDIDQKKREEPSGVAAAYSVEIACRNVPRFDYTTKVAPLAADGTCPDDDCWEEAA